MQAQIYLKNNATFQEVDAPIGDWNLNISRNSSPDGFKLLLPASPKNRLLLPNLSECDALIEVEGVRLFSGRVLIQSKMERSGQTVHYECIFSGGNAGWIQSLSNLYMADLSFGSHTFDANTVETSWNGEQDYVYPCISYGHLHQGNYFSVPDLRPALFLRPILEKAFLKAGYTCQSVFMTSAYFSKLIVPYFGNFRLPEGDITSGRVEATATPAQFIGISAQVLTFTANDDPSSQWSSNTFTADVAGRYAFRLQSIIKNNAIAATSASAWASVNNQKVCYLDGWQSKTFQPGLTSIFSAFEITLQAEDTIQIIMKVESVGSESLEISTESQLQITPIASPITEGATIDFSQILDNHRMSLAALVKDVSKIFNLCILTDNDRKIIYIEPWNTFYADKSTAIDWTYKLESMDSHTLPITATRLQFATDPADYLVKNWEIANRRPYLSFDDNLQDGQQQSIIATTHISPTMMGNEPTATIPIPLLWHGSAMEAASSDFSPRLLYFSGLQSSHYFNWKNYHGGPQEYKTVSLPLAYSINPLLDNSAQSLCFDSIASTHSATIEKGLFHHFYRSWLASSHVCSANTRLSPAEVFSLMQMEANIGSGRKLIFAHGQYYTLQSISNYNYHNGECQVALRQYVFPVESTEIISSPMEHVFRDAPNFQSLPSPIYLQQAQALPDEYKSLLPVAKQNYNSNLVKSVVLDNGTGNVAQPGTAAVVLAEGGVGLGSQFIAGRFNQPNAAALFQVGNGVSATARSTAFEITDTTAYIHGEEIMTSATESVYTFTEGLTNTAGTISADLSTGKAGGQAVIGGNAATENLLLQSTSHASKGYVGITDSPPPSSMKSALALGSGGFDGSAGHFAAKAAGTHIGINQQSAATANFADFQQAGVRRMVVNPNGWIGIGNNPDPQYYLDIKLINGLENNQGIRLRNKNDVDLVIINSSGGSAGRMQLKGSGTNTITISSGSVSNIGDALNGGLSVNNAPQYKFGLLYVGDMNYTYSTSQYGMISLGGNQPSTVGSGGGGFDGVSTGCFSGAAEGTVIAFNHMGLPTPFTGNFLDFQILGIPKFRVNYQGTIITPTGMMIGATAFVADEKLLVNGKARFEGEVELKDAAHLKAGSGSGNMIATSPAQKLAFWGASPITQPTTAIPSATVVSAGGTPLTDTDTFDGYTLPQVVKALRMAGLLQ